MNDTPTAAPVREDVTPAAQAMLRRHIGDGEKGMSVSWGGNPDIPAQAAIAAISEALGLAHTARPDTGDDKAEIERLRGLLIDPGSPAWEDARGILVAELRKAGLDKHAHGVANADGSYIPSHVALNLIAQAARRPNAGHAIDNAADILDQYAGYIATVKADDLERHPYLPSVEQAAQDLRAALSRPDAGDENVERVAKLRPDLEAETAEPSIEEMVLNYYRQQYEIGEAFNLRDRYFAALAAMRDRSTRSTSTDGYATAFYEIATMLGIGAQAASPSDVWRDQMRPKLEALTQVMESTAYRTSLIGRETARADQAEAALAAITSRFDPSDANRPSNEQLEAYLPESVRAEKRCGIQRSAWMTSWFVPWSPRNDNENAEGPWSHWVALAHEILKADAKAIAAAASPANETSRFDPPGLWESEPRSSADISGQVIR